MLIYGWTNPIEKYARKSQNWIISISRGENKKLFQTTTLLFGCVSQSAANPNLLGALLGCLAGSDRNDR